MKKNSFVTQILLLIAILFITVSLQTAVAQDDTTPLPETLSISAPPGTELIIYAEQTDTPPIPIAAPDFGMNLSAAQTATIQVNYINKATTWDTAPGAQAAFQYAVDIWSTLISSSVPIVINANWDPLSTIYGNPYILGSAGSTTISVNNASFPYASTWYPAALANALAGSDLNGATAEITARFNSERTDWYFGTDLNTPFLKYNFATVVLHEIGHGLGFFGSMRYDSGVGSWGYTPTGSSVVYPMIYDRFTENGYGQSMLTFGNPSTALGTQLTSNYLFFDGVNTRQANGGATAPIYAPSSWQSGSSYSHLGDSYNNTENALMTYSLTNGETNYNPGPVALGIFKDMGWDVSPLPVFVPAELAQLPSQLLEVDTHITDAIDAYEYTILEDGFEYDLSYAMIDYIEEGAGVTFNGRFVSINPQPGWTGKTSATLKVTDQTNQPSTSTFTVVVAEEISEVYLPAILR